MGAGTLKLRDGIGNRSIYAAYAYRGKYYYIDGSAWIRWTRHEITEQQYNKIVDWAVNRAETYSCDTWLKPTRLDLAKRTLRVTPPETIKSLLKDEI